MKAKNCPFSCTLHWTGFVLWHPLCAGSAIFVSTDDLVPAACVRLIDRGKNQVKWVKKINNLLCACLLALPSLVMCNGHICMQIG